MLRDIHPGIHSTGRFRTGMIRPAEDALSLSERIIGETKEEAARRVFSIARCAGGKI